MTLRTRLLLPVVHKGRRAVEQARQRWLAFGELWRRSLQLRVVVSTLALSSAVVFVLGMVLQMQITNQLLEAKTNAAIRQAKASAAAVQPDLLGLNPGPDSVRTRFLGAVGAHIVEGGRLHARTPRRRSSRRHHGRCAVAPAACRPSDSNSCATMMRAAPSSMRLPTIATLPPTCAR
jgi:hypothetical protein